MWDLLSFKNNLAVIEESGRQITYAELKSTCDDIFFHIEKTCLVFALCSNTIGSVLGYISFIQHRIVPVLLNEQLECELLKNLIEIYRPSFIWMPERKASEFECYGAKYSKEGYVLLETGYEMDYEMNDELCLLLTTSGSTGSPKFVRQSYENVKANAESIVEYLKLDSRERPISTLPMNYTYGLSIINSHLMVGATLLMTEKGLMQKDFWSFFKEYEATSFGGVPYTYEMLDKLKFFRMDLPSLRYMTQAGGKLTPELHKKYAEYAAETGKAFFVMYGQCEATARMGYLPKEKALEKIGSMGIAIPGGSFKLVDAEGNEITMHDTTGELVYEGPNVTMGYAESKADLAKGDERYGILQTGDMAKFDEDGYYYIVGRKKRFLKLFGNRVNLDELDRLIKTHFDNIEVACTGIDDHLFIFVTEAGLENEILKFLSHKTKLNMSAFQVIRVEFIPKNDAGKILYKELTKYYE